MISFHKIGPRIANILHTLASVSFVIWLIGFFGYQLGGWFFAFLAFAIVSTLLLIRRKKRQAPTVPAK
jgi:hypothetical protein